VTRDNRRRNALDELQRADVCLREARALHVAALPYGAASRDCYAVFHAARAMLVSVGLEARTHKGLVSMIGDHFVRPGKMSPELGRLVSRMQRDREDADYATGAVFTEAEVSRMVADAETFLAEARRLIESATQAPEGDAGSA
jgi:uncharacterized protein (UPF0332 family)